MIIAFILILTFYLKPQQTMKKYDIVLPYNTNGLNAVKCPPGCVRGRCDLNSSPKYNSCKYDFQCNYCNNKPTNTMYVNLNNNRKIEPLYKESNNLSNKQKKTLNNEINDYNDYIKKLNETVLLVNKSNESPEVHP
jgi:hypothetical protein